MFFTSLLQDGPRGLPSNAPDHVAIEQGSVPMRQPAPGNPFSPERPSLSQVDVDVPGCPLNGDELDQLEGWLQARVDLSIRCMYYRKSVWTETVDFCSRLCGGGNA